MSSVTSTSVIYMCEVKVVDDDKGGLRIKVQIPTVDTTNDPDDWPWVFPLLPKHININPKLHETVLVIMQDTDKTRGNRYFIGPLINQQYFLNFADKNNAGSLIESEMGRWRQQPHFKLNPVNEGTVPDREDIALQGRENADLILKPHELQLRCGFKLNPNDPIPQNRLAFNKIDPAFIQMKYDNFRDEFDKPYSSVVNIVADRINLLSHDSPEAFNLAEGKGYLIDAEKQLKICNAAHPLAYGDKLIEFLKLFISLFRNHTHPWAQDKPKFNAVDESTLSTELDQFLSKSIKIN